MCLRLAAIAVTESGADSLRPDLDLPSRRPPAMEHTFRIPLFRRDARIKVSSTGGYCAIQALSRLARYHIQVSNPGPADLLVTVNSTAAGAWVRGGLYTCWLEPHDGMVRVKYWDEGLGASPPTRPTDPGTGVFHAPASLRPRPHHSVGLDECIDEVLHTVLLKSLSDLDPGLQCFHASAVSNGMETVVLVGSSHAGKSTTAIALCSEGFRSIADEILFLDLQTGRIRPFHTPTSYRPNGRGFDIDAFFESANPENGDRRWIKPDFLAAEHAYPLTDVVFLRGFAPEPRLKKIPPLQAFFRLSRACFTTLNQPFRRISLYATGLETVSWWRCDLGAPVPTARTIAAELDRHSRSKLLATSS